MNVMYVYSIYLLVRCQTMSGEQCFVKQSAREAMAVTATSKKPSSSPF